MPAARVAGWTPTAWATWPAARTDSSPASQAQACGFSAAHVARRLRAGVWRTLDDRVLMLPSVTVTPALRDLAAQLTVRGSVLAGLSAARHWGIEVPPAAPHVMVDRRVRPVAGVWVEQARLSARDRTRIDGVPVTTRDRTIFDCLRILPVDDATHLLDRALQQGWVSLADITGRLGAATGRRGVEQVCQLVRAAGDGSRSTAERHATRLLRRAGITGWVANARSATGTGSSESATWCLPPFGSSWNSTAEPSTPRRTGSSTTAPARTASWRRAGPCSASPGTTSSTAPTT